jgi:hypothetical protein
MSSVYALTNGPTPVFNTAAIASCFGGETLPLDEQGLMRTVETVLFPGTPVELLREYHPHIWEMKTAAYPYEGLFIDDRFVTKIENVFAGKISALPSRGVILNTLSQLEKTRYIWGGNWPSGIPLLSEIYPCKAKEPLIQDTWQLKGVDCSGLLYYATQGCTPRNTSSLVNFGKGVEIEGKGASEILNQLQPLDLLVWKGHVVCLLDPKTTIESRLPEGVVKCDAEERLKEIMAERRPVNHWEEGSPAFVARRWYV